MLFENKSEGIFEKNLIYRVAFVRDWELVILGSEEISYQVSIIKTYDVDSQSPDLDPWISIGKYKGRIIKQDSDLIRNRIIYVF